MVLGGAHDGLGEVVTIDGDEGVPRVFVPTRPNNLYGEVPYALYLEAKFDEDLPDEELPREAKLEEDPTPPPTPPAAGLDETQFSYFVQKEQCWRNKS